MPKRMRVGQRERVKVRIGDASVVREHLYEGNWQWIAGTVAIPLIGWGLAHTDIGGIHRSSVMVNLSQPAKPAQKRQSQVKIDTQAEPIPPIPRINRGSRVDLAACGWLLSYPQNLLLKITALRPL
jgi:hypothetical protein